MQWLGDKEDEGDEGEIPCSLIPCSPAPPTHPTSFLDAPFPVVKE
jgi:hypothetical protein